MSIPEQLSTPIAQGRTAEVYSWGPETILKLYHEWCPRDWAENEARVSRIIFEAGIPCPRPGDLVKVKNRQGICYQRVEGVSMLQDLNNRPWMLIRHARTLAKLQAQYQQLTIPGLSSYRDEMGYCIRRAPHLEDEWRAKMLASLSTLPDGQNLCHGDFHPANVLISPRGPVVIDWMTASAGSPWADAARTSMILTIGAKRAGKQVSPALLLLIDLFHQQWLKQFRALTPDPDAEFKRWQPVIAAARLDERIEPEHEALIRQVRGD